MRSERLRVLKALSSEHKLEILTLARRKSGVSAKEVIEKTGRSQSCTSKALVEMENAGLIEGNWDVLKDGSHAKVFHVCERRKSLIEEIMKIR